MSSNQYRSISHVHRGMRKQNVQFGQSSRPLSYDNSDGNLIAISRHAPVISYATVCLKQISCEPTALVCGELYRYYFEFGISEKVCRVRSFGVPFLKRLVFLFVFCFFDVCGRVLFIVFN